MSLIDTTQLALESAARGAWARQTLLTNNIANANTPGYHREDLNFQGALREALADGESPAEVPFRPEVSSQVVGPKATGWTSTRNLRCSPRTASNTRRSCR